MRCSNCGWDNPSGLTKCDKCGAALAPQVPLEHHVDCAVAGTAREGSASAYAGTALENSSTSPSYSQTVREASVFGDVAPATPAATPDRCPECGYPLRPGSVMCPKCHKTFGADAPAPAANNINRNYGGTIMPGMKIAEEKWFSLTPLPLEGERSTPSKKVFDGVRHELNRANLDPDNHTITSKVQAVMEYHSDKKQWYIQDRSALQYTFLCCSGNMPVIDGDVLLMGDRKFVFKAEELPVEPEPQNFSGTVAVGRQHRNVPCCKLMPVAYEDEKETPKELSFRGDAHQLNRANLDPDNNTITSRVQAELTYEQGQWYVKDCSQLQTTYVLCQDPMNLKDADRILMGSRIFLFNC